MARHKLSADGKEAILAALAEFELTADSQQDFLAWCAHQVDVFRPKLHGRQSRPQDLLAWCNRSADAVRRLRVLLSRSPARVRTALRKDIMAVSKRLPHIERQFRLFAKAAGAQIPKNRPPETTKDVLLEQVGSRLIAFGIPVVSTPEKTFIVLSETLWREISGSDDVNLNRHAARALSTLKKNHPQYFSKTRRHRKDT